MKKIAWDEKNILGRRVETPCGPGTVLGACWDAKDRLELHIRIDGDPPGETGLHVYLLRHCTVGRPSRARHIAEMIDFENEGDP